MWMTVGPAQARQCIWNGAGYVVKVKWYRQVDFNRALGKPRPNIRPVQVDKFPLLQRRCTRTYRNEQLIAVISMVGGKEGRAFLDGFLKGMTGVGAALACMGTAGAACVPASAVAGPLADLVNKLPDRADTFAIRIPPRHRHLDVKGTIYNPWTRLGGPIRAKH